ncbi:MAG TPA: L,D-transpeptidase family protein [Geobacteraceae bacterium]|nr:L,D-transpeptidase family protein [Geobacteraceae bacterium]
MKKVILVLLLIFLAAAGFYHMQSRRARETSPSRPSEWVSEQPPTPSDASVGMHRAADLVYIEKKARRLTLFSNGKPILTYRVALGFAPKGKKTTDGDGKTPEGRYIIDRRNPNSRFHRALHISYPNADDRRQAAARGVSPGGDIMIHGLMNSLGWIGKAHRVRDWTLGCIALTNEEIEEVWRLTPLGTPVVIVP